MFDTIFEFEERLAQYTGAPYAIATDCCTHAIELCFRLDKISATAFTPYTYLSIPMLMHKLGVRYGYHQDEQQDWTGEYRFTLTRIWDSARRLERDMYNGDLQCLSFGFDKPLSIGRGGAILCNDKYDYERLKRMSYDGRDLNISPWQEQKVFEVGYHYKPTIEEAIKGLELLEDFSGVCQYKDYPDLRKIEIIQ